MPTLPDPLRDLLRDSLRDPLCDSLRDAAAVVADLGGSAGSFAALDSTQLIAATRVIADLRRHVDQFAVLTAGEIAHRSRRELGHQGMAQKAGFVSPVAMIQSLAQVSKHEAVRLVATGALLAEVQASKILLDDADPSATQVDGATGVTGAIGVTAPEWQNLLAEGLVDGRLSIDKVDAIRRVVSDITTADHSTADHSTVDHTTVDGTAVSRATVDDTAITTAVAELIAGASGQTPEQLFRAAKRARDGIDAEGIERREKQQHDLRSVRTWWDSTGMHCGSWRLAPEDGSLVAEAFEQILSPRRGGPRFVNLADQKTAEDLLNDVRSDEQIAADAFTAMMRLAVDADPGTLFGTRRPAVRVVVTADRLQQPAGHGHLEARHDPVAMATIDRYLCDTGVISIGFDTDGQCVNVGREQRLFTSRQRIGLAIRDGGCRFPGCERPPSYCEAHHINPWKAKTGRTDIADGVLLCRRHHLLIHNNRWNIHRDRANYFLTPPPDIDPAQTLIPMPSRSPITHDHTPDHTRHKTRDTGRGTS